MSNPAKKILIVGATGMLGLPVSHRLLASTMGVRLMASNPARVHGMFPTHSDVVVADVTRAETLDSAVAGCDAIYINLRGNLASADSQNVEVVGVSNLLQAALRHSVRHVGYISGAGHLDKAGDKPAIAIKLAAEKAIVQSGIGYTIFRCTHFMESLDLFVRGNRATIFGHQPHRYHYIAASDYACMVETAFATGPDNDALTVFGPEPYSMREALAIYRDVLQPDLRISAMPLWLARTIARMRGNRELGQVASLFAAFSIVGEDGDPSPAVLRLGAPTTTLREWCEARKAGLATSSVLA